MHFDEKLLSPRRHHRKKSPSARHPKKKPQSSEHVHKKHEPPSRNTNHTKNPPRHPLHATGDLYYHIEGERGKYFQDPDNHDVGNSFLIAALDSAVYTTTIKPVSFEHNWQNEEKRFWVGFEVYHIYIKVHCACICIFTNSSAFHSFPNS